VYRLASLDPLAHPDLVTVAKRVPAFHEGIETHELDGVPVRIFDPEKTLVDCFRYRNQIGMDVALEALRLWRERRKKKLDVLLKYARMRHVERAMRPYLEAMQ